MACVTKVAGLILREQGTTGSTTGNAWFSEQRSLTKGNGSLSEQRSFTTVNAWFWKQRSLATGNAWQLILCAFPAVSLQSRHTRPTVECLWTSYNEKADYNLNKYMHVYVWYNIIIIHLPGWYIYVLTCSYIIYIYILYIIPTYIKLCRCKCCASVNTCE